MLHKSLLKPLLVAATLAIAANAQAALVFVGSWDVYHTDAPSWNASPPNGPLAYTGQEAAALLFGGNASDYLISTIDDQVANIDQLAWYDVIGYGGAIFAQDYSNKYLGLYYGPTYGYSYDGNGAASAFVRDNLVGQYRINYAFRDDDSTPGTIPEPSGGLLLLTALGLAGARLRRRPSKS